MEELKYNADEMNYLIKLRSQKKLEVNKMLLELHMINSKIAKMEQVHVTELEMLSQLLTSR